MCIGACTPSVEFGIPKVVAWTYSNASELMTRPNSRSPQMVFTGATSPAGSESIVSLFTNYKTTPSVGLLVHTYAYR
ncbi:hypothetical protein AZE42_04530 [Rhizopogon vesiculosus]|uniref:Uncharacterized protein n=1 Tax=Rhizopogon vesiculosus TaxID=180088 RepID=A0A1J8PNZ7_9AGAM|nr:hypothetical protein AZE42_04530 [Rhizopogon vesiculosus]